MDEFNPEQRLMVEVLRVTGRDDPEAVVRADPMAAAHIGSYMMPALQKMCEAVAKAAPAIAALAEQLEQARKDARRERMRRAAGWALALTIAAIMWWGIIAAVRWLA